MLINGTREKISFKILFDKLIDLGIFFQLQL